MTKDEIRQWIRERRAARPDELVRRESAAAQERLIALPLFAAARGLCCYLELPGEVRTDRLVAEAWRRRVPVFVPARDRAAGAYRLAALPPGAPLVAGPFGVREPADPAWADDAPVDLAVVPGLAFDAGGGRIGHGAGHYDRLLAAARGRGRPAWMRVGLAFEFQILDALPQEEQDVDMDWIVTEARAFPAGRRAVSRKGGEE